MSSLARISFLVPCSPLLLIHRLCAMVCLSQNNNPAATAADQGHGLLVHCYGSNGTRGKSKQPWQGADALAKISNCCVEQAVSRTCCVCVCACVCVSCHHPFHIVSAPKQRHRWLSIVPSTRSFGVMHRVLQALFPHTQLPLPPPAPYFSLYAAQRGFGVRIHLMYPRTLIASIYCGPLARCL